ncbi:hypothetical protein ACHAWF_001424 [Thalassiosira exigua]
MEWGYDLCVTQDIVHHFAPLETTIRQKFLPALLDIPVSFIDVELCELLGHSVKTGSIGIRNPVSTAGAAFEVSRNASLVLVDLLLTGRDFCCGMHARQVRKCAQHVKFVHLPDEEAYAADLQRKKLSFAVRTDRATKAGTWFTCHPALLNGNTLSSEQQFRNNLRLRYNLKPLGMPQLCDGCGEKLTVDHAFSCKCDGLVLIRHEDGVIELRELLRLGWTSSHVEREPLISNSTGAGGRGPPRTKIGWRRLDRTPTAPAPTNSARRPSPAAVQPPVPPAQPLSVCQQRQQLQQQQQHPRQQLPQRPPQQPQKPPRQQQKQQGRQGPRPPAGAQQQQQPLPPRRLTDDKVMRRARASGSAVRTRCSTSV